MICVGELSKGAGQGRRVSYSFAACVWVPVWLLFGSCLVPIVSIVLGWLVAAGSCGSYNFYGSWLVPGCFCGSCGSVAF